VQAFRITVPRDQEDAATTILWEAGTAGVQVLFEAAGSVELLAYFPEDPDTEAALAEALAGIPGARPEPARVPEVDWVARFREGFRPLQAGGFCIAPPWNVPDPPPGRLLLVDPGRAFGTGTHETTRLCLAALESRAARRPLGRVLDVGTGSGVLAVAAAMLGARPACGVDNDPEAVAAARRHAELNRVDLPVLLGDGSRPFRAGAFDVLLANLTAPLLEQKAGELAAACAPGGVIVLSGLLVDDLSVVRRAYDAYGPVTEARDGEWAALQVEIRR
jgi:ribosomal protein L11 methyltransferase